MILKITIKMDNAAFDPDSGTEAARILRELADKLDGGDVLPDTSIPLLDVNGNKVGRAEA